MLKIILNMKNDPLSALILANSVATTVVGLAIDHAALLFTAIPSVVLLWIKIREHQQEMRNKRLDEQIKRRQLGE